jgi:hypothetical protein
MSRQRDLEMLTYLVEHDDFVGIQDDDETYNGTIIRAFRDMREALMSWQHELRDKQRAWVTNEYQKREPEYENLVSSGKVALGKPVPTLDILKPENLPKSPPRRRQA